MSVGLGVGELLLSTPGMLRCLAEMDPVDVDLLVDHVVLRLPWAEIERAEELPRTVRERRWVRIRTQIAATLHYTAAVYDSCAECGAGFEPDRNGAKRFCGETCRKRHYARCGTVAA